jgi:hypothetical protein
MKKTFFITLCLTLVLAACHKDNPTLRSKMYIFVPDQWRNVSGMVFFRETTDPNKTQVDIQLSHLTYNGQYAAHLHEGPPANYKGYAPFAFMPLYASGYQLSYQSDISISYDSACRFDGTFILHDSANVVLGRCGVGKNGI